MPRITEVMADNDRTLRDGDGNSSDWIELHNAGDETADLTGWYLTDQMDDLTKWTFPGVVLQPDEYLVVFASGQDSPDYVDAGGNVHTNFSLERDGEYVALVQPDGVTVASEFGAGESFPQQFEDVSYGVSREVAVNRLIPEDATSEVLVPSDDSLGTTWTTSPAPLEGASVVSSGGIGFAPTVDGLDFWLKAEHIADVNSGDPLRLWPDSSGNLNDALQIDPNAQPLFIDDAIGDMAVVRFDGDDDFLQADSLFVGSETTIFFVTRNSPQTTDGSFHRGILTSQNNPYRGDGNGYGFGYQRGNVAGYGVSLGQGVGGSSEQRIDHGLQPDDEFELVAYRKGDGMAELWRDGQLVISGAQADPVGGYATGYNIGADPSFASREYQGDIAEILVFDRSLSETDFTAVQQYLRTEYDLDSPPDGRLEPALMSYWDFDDETVVDRVGENDAVANVGAAFQADAPTASLGNSLDLSGSDNYVQLPSDDYGITDQFTISAWVKPEDTTGGRFFSIKRDLTSVGGDRSGINIGLAGGNSLYAGIITPPGGNAADFNDVSSQTLSIPAGEWSHVAVTLSDDRVTMYVNGVAEASYSNSGTPNAGELKTTDNDVDFDDQNGSFTGFGADGRGGNLPADLTGFFSGLMDEVAVWNVALTARSVESLAHGSAPPDVLLPGETPAGLVSHWNFEDQAIVDAVGDNDAVNNVGASISPDAPSAGGAGSLNLTGPDNYVELPAVDYGIANQYTISAWVKPDDTTGGRFFSLKRDLTSAGGDRSGINFGLAGGNSLYTGLITPPGPNSEDFNDITTTSLSIPAGEWSHVAVTLSDDRVTMYVNGVAETSYSNSGTTNEGQLKTTGNDVDFDDQNGSFSGFGADGRGGNLPAELANFFSGLLDEIAVWNVALPGSSVALLAAGDAPADVPLVDEGPEPGLMAHWNFDDGTVTDQVGDSDAVTSVDAGFTADAPTTGGAGSLDLTGTTNYVELPPVDYGIANQYTISAWVKPDDTTGGRFFSIKRDLTSGGGDRSGVNFGLAGGNSLYSGIITPPGANAADFNDVTTQSLSIPAGEWSHIAVTLSDDRVTMYVNGVAETSYSNSGTLNEGQLKTTGNDVDFDDQNGSFSGFGADGRGGSFPADLTGFFSGLLDEIAVWNVALPATSVALLAAGDAPADVPLVDEGPEPGLMAHWNFDDGTVTDQVGDSDSVSLVDAGFTADVPAAGGAGSLDLIGTTNYVELPSVDYGITNQYTISAWVKPDDTTGGRFFSIKRDLTGTGGDRSGVNFGLAGGNSLYTGLITPPGPNAADFNDITSQTLSIPAGEWSHIAVTLSDDRVTMYVNGVAETSYNNSGTLNEGQLKTTGNDVDFDDQNGSFSGFGADGRGGSLPADLTGFFSGLLDEIAVWNVTLPGSSVERLAAGDAPGDVPLVDEGPEPGLMAHWNFDDGTVTDQVGDSDSVSLVDAGFTADVPAAGGAGSLDLTGTTNYVELPSVDYGIANQYTISAWVKPDDTTGGRFFSIKRDLTGTGGDRSGVNFGLAGGNSLYTGIITPPGPNAADFNDITTQTLSIPAGEWSHIAVTLSDDQVTMYVNGVAETSYNNSGTTNEGQLKTTGNDVDFDDQNGSFSGFGADGRGGNLPADLSSFFSGLLDEIAVWNVALPGSSVALLAAGDAPADVPLAEEPPEPKEIRPEDFESSRLAPLIDTDVSESMLGADGAGVNATIYVRTTFDVEDTTAYDSLFLTVRYDDGFIAYLNGTEIARRNAPESAAWNSAALEERPLEESIVEERIDVSEHLGLLNDGANLLAIHAMNYSADDPEFLISAWLADIDVMESDGPRYFDDPTPGEPNGAGINNSGPAISSVGHEPVRPSATDDLVVTARIAPTANLASATLTYRVMYGDEFPLPMVDDGTGGDLTAGDGVYSATIPASAFSDGQMVRYYVSTLDDQGNPARKPEFFLPERSAEYFGTVVIDPSIPDTNLPILEWFVEDPTWHVETNGNNRSITFASVFFDDQFYDNLRVRVRGGVTQDLAKPNFKFDFYAGGLFQYDPGQLRVEEFNLQSLLGEIATRTYMRNPLAYQLFRDAGHAAPYSNYTHVRQNGQFYSLAAMEEQIDERFLERYGFDPQGALYKAKSGAMLQLDPSPGQWVKGTRQDEDFSDLTDFTEGLVLSDPVEREQYVFDNVNIPQVIHYLAITLLGPNHDRLTHNYYVYRDTNDTGEWSVFPWDLDRWFPQGDLLTNPVATTVFYGDSDHPRYPGDPADRYNRLNDAIFDIPETREMFLTHLRTVVDRWMNTSYLEESVDAIETLIALDAALDNAKWGVGSLDAGVAAIKNTIATRRAQLAADPNIPPSTIDVIRTPLVEFGAQASTLLPADDSLGQSWTAADYVEGSQGETWIDGTTGIGYEQGTGYQNLIGTDVGAAMFNLLPSVYTRVPFDYVTGQEQFDRLTLRMRYDDAFVAYLNGVEIARSANLDPGQVRFDSPVIGGNHEAAVFENFDVADYQNILVDGANVLAVHGLNRTLDSSDLLLLPELVGIREEDIEPGGPDVTIDVIEFSPSSGNQDEEYITLVNNDDRAVDMTGWHLSGGVEFDFQPGTVIPAGGTMYVVADVKSFRERAEGPGGRQGLFVQGGYQGRLSSFGETLELADAEGQLVASAQYDGDPSPAQLQLRVSEINYNPLPPTEEELLAKPDLQSEDFEFVELTNIGDQPLSLEGVHFTQGIEFSFGQLTLEPGDYVLVVQDMEAFEIRYGSELNVAGAVLSGRLNNDGELIKIEDAQNNTIQEFEYNDGRQWPQLADGRGATLEMIDFDADASQPSSWRDSREYQGTPGFDGSGPVASVVINETLTNSETLGERWIELFNPTDSPIDIGGWYLSDSASDFRRHEFAAGTVVPAAGYLVLSESAFNPGGGMDAKDIVLDAARGGELYLLEADANDVLIAFSDFAPYEAAWPDETLGRWPNGDGSFVPLRSPTEGATNDQPRIGPLIISELMFHPATDDDQLAATLEFLEIHNPTDQLIELDGWRLTGGIQYAPAEGTSIQPAGVLVVVSFDPSDLANGELLSQFRDYYQIDESVVIVGPFSGQLNNAGDLVRLMRPGTPPADDPDLVPLIVGDEVEYDDVAPWPTEADGGGSTLARRTPVTWGMDATSWLAETPSPGAFGAAPRVTDVTLNGGIADPPDLPSGQQPTSWRQQRSLWRNIQVTFSESVTLDASHLTLTNLGVDAPNDDDSPVPLSDDQLQWDGSVLTIMLDDNVADGVYRLEISSDVTDQAGNPLDGDGDGVGGDGYVLTGGSDNDFYQLSSDWDGDQGVAIFDFSVFAYWFGQSLPAAPAYMDLNDDLGVSIFDFTEFAGVFGRGVTFPPAPLLSNSVPSSASPIFSVRVADEPAEPSSAPPSEHALDTDPPVVFRHLDDAPRDRRASAPRPAEIDTWEDLLEVLARDLAVHGE